MTMTNRRIPTSQVVVQFPLRAGVRAILDADLADKTAIAIEDDLPPPSAPEPPAEPPPEPRPLPCGQAQRATPTPTPPGRPRRARISDERTRR